jgi:hypothetical protein
MNRSANALRSGDRGGRGTGLDAGLCQQAGELAREQRIPIMDEIAVCFQEAVLAVGDVAGDLLHPQAVWRFGDSADLHAPGSDLDKEEDHEALQAVLRPDFDCEEISGDNLVRMPGEELLPRGLSLPVRRRFDPVPPQDVRNGTGRNLVAEIGHRTLDAVVAPVAVLPSHANDESFDFRGNCGSAATSPPTTVILVRDQSPMPCQQRVRRHNGGNFVQYPSAQLLGSNGKPPALIVGEADSAVSDLFPQDTVLFNEIIHGALLMLAQPTGYAGDYEPERI